MRIPIDHRTISLMLEQAMHQKYYQVNVNAVQTKELATYSIHFKPTIHANFTVLLVEFTRDSVQVYRPTLPNDIKLFGYNFRDMINSQEQPYEKLTNMINTFMTDINHRITVGII